jgi:hypothetical protein
MGDSDKAAIASFVMRGKEYLADVVKPPTALRIRPAPITGIRSSTTMKNATTVSARVQR